MRHTLTVVSWLALDAAGLAASPACILGYRGSVEFSGSESLAGIDALRLALPSTPMEVVGAGTSPELSYQGVWHSLGGTSKVAETYTTRPRLQLQSDGTFAQLSAVIPLEVQSLVDLEMELIQVPAALDLEIDTGLGDIDVRGVSGAVLVNIRRGDVMIDGGDLGVAVSTDEGTIDITTAGHTDVISGIGSIDIVQRGTFERDVFVEATGGNVHVELVADANLDLWVLAGGRIRVQTETVSTVTDGHYSRVVGQGTHRVWIETGLGNVDIVRAATP